MHLDDITGRQVLVSVTDRDDRVVFGPKSVRKGDRFHLPPRGEPELAVEVVRLRNVLAGGGDFAEFLVKPAPPAPPPPPPTTPEGEATE